MSEHTNRHGSAERGGQRGSDLGATADNAVAQLAAIDEKVNAMREERINDPDTLGDKVIKIALPSLAGLLAGRIFQTVWNAATAKKDDSDVSIPDNGRADDGVSRGLLTSLLFAALSAAFGAVVSQLSDRGSKAFVARRQRKRVAKHYNS